MLRVYRRVPPPFAATNRCGFSLIEVLFVLLISGILGVMMVPQIARYTSQRAASNARDAFILTAARARAAAIQSGDEVQLTIDPANGLVSITDLNGTAVGDALDFNNGVVRASMVGTDGFTICYVPRGFERPGCRVAEDSIIGFASPEGRDTAWARVTIAQVVRR